MAIFKFRVSWEGDTQIYRDIVLKSGQTFYVFQSAILKAFEFKKIRPASFFESNDHWHQKREISSEVLTNKKGAPALSSLKTPVSALIDRPEKHFVFVYDPDKEWTFLISLIHLQKEEDKEASYPILLHSEGIAPQKTSSPNEMNEIMEDIKNKFDLDQGNLGNNGFEEEG